VFTALLILYSPERWLETYPSVLLGLNELSPVAEISPLLSLSTSLSPLSNAYKQDESPTPKLVK